MRRHPSPVFDEVSCGEAVLSDMIALVSPGDRLGDPVEPHGQLGKEQKPQHMTPLQRGYLSPLTHRSEALHQV